MPRPQTRTALIQAALMLALVPALGAPALAQDRPAAHNDRPVRTPAASQSAADAARPANRPGSENGGTPARPPTEKPAAVRSKGEQASTDADGASPAPKAAPPAASSAAGAKPKSQGRLIPPEEMPPAATDTATGVPVTAPVPLGPPVPETLRESDFDFASCELGLVMMGTRYTSGPAITDPSDRDCGIARPVRVTEILPGITIQGGADMRCDTARALGRWLQEMVLPAASHLPGAPQLQSLTPGTTYQCRGVVGGASASRLSEHATGNAIDIAAFGFSDGTTIPVEPRADRGDIMAAFQNTVQASACLFFNTVLGPGSNAAHDNHLHLDIKGRRGDFRLCQ